MFDPFSVEKIKSAPKLEDVDIERLPEYLSLMYTKIVDLRRQIILPDVSIEREDQQELVNLWNLAHTYSALTIGGNLNDNQKLGAAFVAGNAFSLLWQADKIGLINFDSLHHFTNYSISPIILSSILFMIAEQPADAFEASEKIELKLDSLSVINVLERAISYLIQGKLRELSKLPEPELPNINKIINADLEFSAYQILWDKIIFSIKMLAGELLSSKLNEDSNLWQILLNEVIELSIDQQRNNEFEFISCFAAPYHLAKLLLEMGKELVKKSVVKIPVPSGIDEDIWFSYLKTVAIQRPYLWKNHYDSIKSGFLTPGISSVITFPTGAGKSTITELKIVSTLLSGKGIIFLVPTKALVDQIERDLKKNLEKFFTKEKLTEILLNIEPENFSIDKLVNGSIVEDNYFIDFQEGIPKISVMTPERCLSIISIEKETFCNTGLIVFDECHLLHGGGSQIERRGLDAMFSLLKLISIPENKPDILLSSAMVNNGVELANWLSDILEKECLSLDLRWKPTRQARGCVIYNKKEIDDLKKIVTQSKRDTTTKTPPAALKRQLYINADGLFCLKQTWNTQSTQDYTKIRLLNDKVLITASGKRPNWYLTANRNKVAAKIGQFFSEMGIKTLIFADSPRNANSISKEAACLISDTKKVSYQEDDKKIFDICRTEVGSDECVSHLEDYKTACHHGLLFLHERRLVEQMFRKTDSQGIDLLAATPTLAQGMNLPVELVILAGEDRFDPHADSRQMLQAHELLNASGRAGRAGWIATGLVILIPSEIISINETDDGIALNEHWFKLQELIYSQEDQCLDLIDPIELCLDAIQDETEDSQKIGKYFLYRLPKIQGTGSGELLKKSFGFSKAKNNNSEQSYLHKIENTENKIRELIPDEDVEDWVSALATETGVSINIIADIMNFVSVININFDCFDWIDYIAAWIISNEDMVSNLFPMQELKDVLKSKVDLKTITFDEIIAELIALIKIWMQGETIFSIGEWLGSTNEKCKNTRKFIIRLLPRISFVFGLFPLVYKKMMENSSSDISIPATFGSLAGCIREGFDLPLKLALYQLIVKHELTCRVLIHRKFNELEMDKISVENTDTFDDLLKNLKYII